MIRARPALESDAEAVRDIFLAVYGPTYPYHEYYDLRALKKLVFSDDSLLLVAEETDTGDIVGTASVLLEMGAYADLVGEFGRLAVHPEACRLGVGKLLMQRRLELVEDRLHMAFVETRVIHDFAQRIAVSHGFHPVGLCPLKLLFGERQSLAVMVRYWGDALQLRRNHPRIVPEIESLAQMALTHCGIRAHTIVDETTAPYPYCNGFHLEELTTEGYASLLRFQRGRVERREIFGPMRLHYGWFRLRAHKSHYVIARNGDVVVGAVGFMVDEVERVVRIFELISLSDEPIRLLLSEVERRCRAEWGTEYIEVDVSAYAPAMQRTLVELNYVPVAYLPAMVFHQTERLDAVKMARLLVPPNFDSLVLVPETVPVSELVMNAFSKQAVLPELANSVERIALFTGLNDEQAKMLACACGLAQFAAGEQLFVEGHASDRAFLLISGSADVFAGDGDDPAGWVGPGDCLGEVSLLSGTPHSATAIARTPVSAAAIAHEDLQALVRRRPDIGVILYRNLAQGLGDKLIRVDHRVGQMGRQRQIH